MGNIIDISTARAEGEQILIDGNRINRIKFALFMGSILLLLLGVVAVTYYTPYLIDMYIGF